LKLLKGLAVVFGFLEAVSD
jgi:hypothetical protein